MQHRPPGLRRPVRRLLPGWTWWLLTVGIILGFVLFILHHRHQDSVGRSGQGIDYLKYDNPYNEGLKRIVRYPVMSRALMNTRRPIFHSLCECMVSRVVENEVYAEYARPGGWNDENQRTYLCTSWNKLGTRLVIEVEHKMAGFELCRFWNIELRESGFLSQEMRNNTFNQAARLLSMWVSLSDAR